MVYVVLFSKEVMDEPQEVSQQEAGFMSLKISEIELLPLEGKKPTNLGVVDDLNVQRVVGSHPR